MQPMSLDNYRYLVPTETYNFVYQLFKYLFNL